MPLTTYTPGQVLDAASLNANLVFAAANPPGGLTLISTTTIGTTVSSVTVSSAFSATYDSYKIVVTGGLGSTNTYFNFQLGASTASYANMSLYNNYNSAAAGLGTTTGSKFEYTGSVSASNLAANIELQNPFLAKFTAYQSTFQQTALGGFTTGLHQLATSYTDFTISPASGTITGGTVRVYGYQNS